MKKDRFKNTFLPGSAFIMVFVLTSLLALIGLVFLLTSRVDKLSTSSIEQNKQLDDAVDTIISEISQQLVMDTPGIDPNEEYYDYPDPYNLWLASLEPYEDSNGDYRWQQISDVTGFLFISGYPTQNVNVDKIGTGKYVDDYPVIDVDINGNLVETSADADGDGIADSKWIELFDLTTNKGEPVYAAIRVIDNGGMLNVNTGCKFVPFGYDVPANEIDGSRQLQVNLSGLSQREGSNGTLSNAAAKLHSWRCDYNDNTTLSAYEGNVIWRYINAVSGYTPFDMSDEVELRNRYVINNEDIKTRLEQLWTYSFNAPTELNTPVDGKPKDIDDWFYRTQHNIWGPNDIYSYRHLGTTYNLDRIIDPRGDRMVNINKIPEEYIEGQPPAQWIYAAKLLPCLNPDSPDYNRKQAEFAQVAANIKDYSDPDTKVTTVLDVNNSKHYGFERPEIHISELTYGYTYIDTNNPGRTYKEAKDANDPNIPYFLHRSYAIEIHNSFSKYDDFNDWRLVIDNPSRDYIIDVNIDLFQSRGGRYYVAIYEDPCAPLSQLVVWSDTPDDGARGVDPNVKLGWGDIWGRDPNGRWVVANAYDVYFGTDFDRVRDANDKIISSDPFIPLWPEYQGRKYADIGDPNSNIFDPFGSAPMQKDTTYYWRIAGVNDIDHILNNDDDVIIDSGQPPWSFTTWLIEPNSVVKRIDVNFPDVFTPRSFIRLERRVKNDWEDRYIIVDILGPSGTPDANAIPVWLFDVNNADIELRTRSFQRDLSSMGRLKRLWNYDPEHPSAIFPTLGHRNNFSWPPGLPLLQSHHHRLNNIGELGFIFKKSTYYEVPDWTERIQKSDKEYDEFNMLGERVGIGVELDLTRPEVQRLCNFLTVMDPNNRGYNLNETRIKGRININTAPWFVLAQLPWVSTHTSLTANYDLAKAIEAYRDKTSFLPDLDYTTRLGYPGFENIGQLNNVIHSRPEASIDYFGRDKEDQRGYPDLSTNRRTKVDGYPDDMEERDLIFARISDLVTVRSDVFTAYILVRLGRDGPQKRVMAILDRSGVLTPADKVKIVKLYEVPDAR